ncbi:hypothetical protein ACOMHN_002732 [Nucella lapillus]
MEPLLPQSTDLGRHSRSFLPIRGFGGVLRGLRLPRGLAGLTTAAVLLWVPAFARWSRHAMYILQARLNTRAVVGACRKGGLATPTLAFLDPWTPGIRGAFAEAALEDGLTTTRSWSCMAAV